MKYHVEVGRRNKLYFAGNTRDLPSPNAAAKVVAQSNPSLFSELDYVEVFILNEDGDLWIVPFVDGVFWFDKSRKVRRAFRNGQVLNIFMGKVLVMETI